MVYLPTHQLISTMDGTFLQLKKTSFWMVDTHCSMCFSKEKNVIQKKKLDFGSIPFFTMDE
jgi:hypothetical protein